MPTAEVHKLTMVKGLPFLFLLFCFSTCFSQDCSELYSDTFVHNGDTGRMEKPMPVFNSSLKSHLNELIECDSDELRLLARISKTYAKLNQTDSALRYLERSIIKGAGMYTICDPSFQNVQHTADWKALIIKHSDSITRTDPVKDLPLAMELWKKHISDQAYYPDWDSIVFIHGRKSKQFDSIIKLKRNISKDHVRMLDSIVSIHGWPAKRIVGSLGSSAAFLVVQHASKKQRKQYLPLLIEAAKNNEAEKSEVALMVDRFRLECGKRQLYGSQIGGRKKAKVLRLKSPKYEDQRRAEMGLGPLSEYASWLGAEFTVEQKSK